MREHREIVLLAGCLVFGAMVAPTHAQQINNASYLASVNIDVLPIAQLDFIGSSLLYLEIPPADSTIPFDGVRFVVTGNASASLSAEPDAFIDVASEGFMGKAVLNGESVGYKLELRFPRTGAVGSPIAYGALPGFSQGPAGPLTVDLMATGGSREGEIHMEAAPNWTPTGGIPLPGIYVGQVMLTLTAS